MSLYKCDKCGKELSSEDFKTGEAIMDESSKYFIPLCAFCHAEHYAETTRYGALKNESNYNRMSRK